MKTISGCGSFGRQLFCTVSFLMLAIGIASAQTFINVDPTASASLATDTSETLTPTTTPIKLTDAQLADEWMPTTIITNIVQLADGFSSEVLFYMPDTYIRWNLYLIDGVPWWVDFSKCPGLQALLTNQCFGSAFYGVTPRRITLTLELLTGEIVVRSQCTSEELLRLKPPADYQPGQWPAGSVAAARLWKQWLAERDDPNFQDMYGPLETPALVLHVLVGDLIYEKPARDKNFVAEIVAWETEQAQTATEPSKTLSRLGGGGMRLMMLSNGTCPITNEADAFGVDIATDINGAMTVTWQSCSDHVYGVLSADELTMTTTWVGRAGMWGQDGTTSWTDTTAPTVTHRFYKVVRMPPDGDFDGDGIPNGWEATNGLNPLDSTDASQFSALLWAQGLTNLQAYQEAITPPSFIVTDPTNNETIYP